MIFYFSATGNCLHTALRLQQTLGGQLHSIPQLLQERRFSFAREPGEAVGFVIPVFFFSLPRIVTSFLAQLELTGSNAGPTFLVATFGSITGAACEEFQQALFARGIGLEYRFALKMPDNYVPLFRIPNPRRVDAMLHRADRELEDIIHTIQAGPAGDYNVHKGPFPKAVSRLTVLLHLDERRTKMLWVRQSACRGCGLCADVCPVGAIAMGGRHPNWVAAECEMCLGCLHRCPDAAIQYRRVPSSRGRYVNPRVDLSAGRLKPGG